MVMRFLSKISKLLLIGLFVTVAHLASAAVVACECVQLGGAREITNARDRISSYDAVFLGYVTSIRLITTDTPVRENEYRYDDEAEVTFRVRRAWKGVAQPTVRVVTATQGPACGYPFQVGQYYLVYADVQPKTLLLACSTCSPTKELRQAGHEIVSLGPPTFQAEEKQSK